MTKRFRATAIASAVALLIGVGATTAQALTVYPAGTASCTMAATKNGGYARVTNQTCWQVQVRIYVRDSGGTVRAYNGPASGHFSEKTVSGMITKYAGRGQNVKYNWAETAF